MSPSALAVTANAGGKARYFFLAAFFLTTLALDFGADFFGAFFAGI
jgi:hypothetical protein